MFEVCTEWAEESYDQCGEWEDQGYDACADWDERCCDWWPCSWLCKVVTLVCVATVWITKMVCVAWTTITTLSCIVWEVVTLVLVPLTFVVELVLSIPILGRIVSELLNVVQTIVVRLAQVPDALLTLVGITPLKKMRVCIIVLRDEDGARMVDDAALDTQIQAAQQIFLDEANVEMVVEGIHTVDGPSPDFALDVGCNEDAWWEDLWLTGGYFEATAAWHCPTGGTGRLTGFAHPIVVFCVRDIPGTTAGCALGPVTDYLTIEGRNPICLAHEIGHKVGLWHCCPGTNLANGTCGGIQLELWQRMIVRNSKYVTYV